MIISMPERRPRLAKIDGEAPLSPVPEATEAALPKTGDDKSSASVDNVMDGKKCGDDSNPTLLTESTKSETEESVTQADDAGVDPYAIKNFYGDVLSHLITLPFEAQTMLKFHQTKVSHSTKDGRRKRKKPPRKNTVPIFSQKQYLRGAGLMPLYTPALAVEGTKKKRSRTINSPAIKSQVIHSNRNECAEFSPRSVKPLESPKRSDTQEKDASTTVNNINSHLNQNTTAVQEQPLAQTQQHQLFINNQQSQFQRQQLPSYYDPLQAVNHQVYNHMLMSSYSFNPYIPYQMQLGYQHFPPQQLSQSYNPDHNNDVIAAAVAAAEAANQNLHSTQMYAQFSAYLNNINGASFQGGVVGLNTGLPLPTDFGATNNAIKTNSKVINDTEMAAEANGVKTTVTVSDSDQKSTQTVEEDKTTLGHRSNGNNSGPNNIGDDAIETSKCSGEDKSDVNKVLRKKAVAKERDGKQKKGTNGRRKVKVSSKVSNKPAKKGKGQNVMNNEENSIGAEFPPGWTSSERPRKTGRGFYTHFVSPNNNTFRSQKSALAFIAILKELKKKNGEEPTEVDALAIFERRGYKR